MEVASASYGRPHVKLRKTTHVKRRDRANNYPGIAEKSLNLLQITTIITTLRKHKLFARDLWK